VRAKGGDGARNITRSASWGASRWLQLKGIYVVGIVGLEADLRGRGNDFGSLVGGKRS